MTLGCARLPPGQNITSGKRLHVTMRFATNINPVNHYFFLINNAGSQNAPGPIAVFSPGNNGSYGNGFASGTSGQVGFTDFMEFDNLQISGYSLRHVIGDPALSNFSNPVQPQSYVPLNPDPTQTSDTLDFTIDLAQLATNPDGSPLTDRAQAVTLSKTIRYLQVNIVATNSTPRGATSVDANKEVDSMGDTRTSEGQTSYLTIDLGQYQTNYATYTSGDSVALNTLEPSGDDVYPPGVPHDQSLNLLNWTIDYSNYGQ